MLDIPALYSRFSLYCDGDSLTFGRGGTTLSTPYSDYLMPLVGWRPTYNAGVSGNTSTQIKDRILANTTQRQWLGIFWPGRNDIQTFGTGWRNTTRANIAAIDSTYGAADNPNWLLLGITAAPSEYPGAGSQGLGNYTEILAHNAEMATTYGDRFIDIRSWMVESGLAAVGLTPTAQDTIDIANDVVPTSLRRDPTNLHYNSLGYQAVAIRLAPEILAIDAGNALNVTLPALFNGA